MAFRRGERSKARGQASDGGRTVQDTSGAWGRVFREAGSRRLGLRKTRRQKKKKVLLRSTTVSVGFGVAGGSGA